MTPEESSSLDLDLLAAALRADLTDTSAFVEGLATRLEQALPGFVQVKRAKRGFRGPKFVTEIAVQAADLRLVLQRDGGDVRTVRAKASGGIVLKTESVDIDTWLASLTAAVAAQAERSERTRQALQQLVLDR
ncbi:MAG TPA: hypothetical protein VHV75_01015 [Solirubrobacteraceae bacterium]|nr:hypothetical protein [Solirubrobacteraceae bacterium]